MILTVCKLGRGITNFFLVKLSKEPMITYNDDWQTIQLTSSNVTEEMGFPKLIEGVYKKVTIDWSKS